MRNLLIRLLILHLPLYIGHDPNIPTPLLEISPIPKSESWYKVGTQFGTQKGAEGAVEAVDAVHAERNFLRKFSAC